MIIRRGWRRSYWNRAQDRPPSGISMFRQWQGQSYRHSATNEDDAWIATRSRLTVGFSAASIYYVSEWEDRITCSERK